MEPVRPVLDRYVLDVLARRTFSAADFHETRQGVCRITPPLARELALTAPDWARAVGRVAEDVARRLADPAEPALPTPITGRRRAASRPEGPRAERASPGVATVSRRCTTCGTPIDGRRRVCSDECSAIAAADGQATLSALREVGFERELSPAGRRRIGTRGTELFRAGQAWRRTHEWPEDMGAFAREILPGLAHLPPAAIVRATGLSSGYVRRVKAGEVTPHPMWWDVLREISSS